MLAIKLQRIGKKHQPSYRLVVAERRSKMAAPPVEDLGAYNPFTKGTFFDKDRAAYWIKCGAQPTVTAYNLLVSAGVITGAKRSVKMKKAEVKAEAAGVEASSGSAKNPAENPAAEEKSEVVSE